MAWHDVGKEINFFPNFVRLEGNDSMILDIRTVEPAAAVSGQHAHIGGQSQQRVKIASKLVEKLALSAKKRNPSTSRGRTPESSGTAGKNTHEALPVDLASEMLRCYMVLEVFPPWAASKEYRAKETNGVLELHKKQRAIGEHGLGPRPRPGLSGASNRNHAWWKVQRLSQKVLWNAYRGGTLAGEIIPWVPHSPSACGHMVTRPHPPQTSSSTWPSASIRLTSTCALLSCQEITEKHWYSWICIIDLFKQVLKTLGFF